MTANSNSKAEKQKQRTEVMKMSKKQRKVSMDSSQRRMDTVIGHVIQHAFLVAKIVPNYIPSQVNMAKANVEDHTGNKIKLLSCLSGY